MSEHERNVHCSNCGDTRGGSVGHEISECTFRHDNVPRETPLIDVPVTGRTRVNMVRERRVIT